MGVATVIYYTVLLGIEALVLRRDFKLIYLLQFFVGLVYGYFTSFTNGVMANVPLPEELWFRIIEFAASIMLISLLQNINVFSKFLLFMNKYSFQIYLLHTIFTAGIRIILMRLSITSWVIHIIVGTLCGIVFSVLAAVIAKKIKILNIFFFPTKTYKQLKTKA